MTEDEISARLFAGLDAHIAARLVPVVRMLAGYQAALVSILAALHDRGTLTADEAHRAIAGRLSTMDAEAARGESAAVLRQLLEATERLRSGGGTRPNLN